MYLCKRTWFNQLLLEPRSSAPMPGDSQSVTHNQQLMQSATTYMDHSSITAHPLPAQIQWRSCFLRSEVFLVHLSAPS